MLDSETPRRSQRSNKGIPAARLIVEKSNCKSERAMSQGNAEPQRTPENPQINVSVSNVSRPNPSSQITGSTGGKQSTLSQASGSASQQNPLSKMAGEFDHKMAEMRNEFSRQMHAMQELMRANTERVTNSIRELQNERNIGNVSASQRTAEEVQRSSSLGSENGSRNMEHRHKKIYPLPRFTGTPEEWHSFYESFTSTTLEFDYSDLHNIMRLRDAVQGKARETVEALLSNSANVNAILEILKETYGRPEQLIKSQIEKIREIAPLKENNLERLVDLVNKITNMVTFLKSSNGEHHLSNPTLLSEIVVKLPTTRQLQWAEKCLYLGRPATVVDLCDWLNVIRRIANMVSDSLPVSAQKGQQSTSVQTSTSSSQQKGRNYVHVAIADRKCASCGGECRNLEACNAFQESTVEQRWNKVKEIKVCFSCLKKGHRTAQCYKKAKCGTDSCQGRHHSLLHNPQRHSSSKDDDRAVETETVSTAGRVSCHTNDVVSTEDVLFQVLPVKLYGNGTTVSTYAFIDDGANATILDSQIAQQLGVNGKRSTLELFWLNQDRISEATQIISLEISGVEKEAKRFKMSNVFTSSKLALPSQSFDARASRERNVYLTGLPLNSYDHVQPKIIISLTHAYLTVPIEVPRTGAGPIAVRTRLGWLAYGPTNFAAEKSIPLACHAYCKCDNKMNDIISSYFSIESFGVKPHVKPPISKDDAFAMKILNETTKKIDGRYEVGLLWRECRPSFPDSFDMAKRRLEGVERKMTRDPEFAKKYKEKIASYIEKGYAERLSEEEANCRTARTFYIPHFGVSNANKEGIRIVFDAAAEVRNISLNKLLLPGPDLNQPLIAVLFKFRQAPVAVTGDIQEMFHQICVRKEDCDSQRFIWRDGNRENPIETYVMKRLIFGATCSPVAAQHIKNLNARTFSSIYPRAVKAICENHYVDDYADCFQSEEEAIRTVTEVKKIHSASGFKLRNLNSNSKKVKEVCGGKEPEEAVKIEKDLDRILGIHWVTSTDSFVFKLKLDRIPGEVLEFQRKPTKRELLRLHMSVFDPYGFLVNFMITAKAIMQAVWKAHIEWDEWIPDEIYVRWKSWMEDLPNVMKLKVPRCYMPEFEKAIVDLHIFADASEQALAVVAYWRAVADGKVCVMFVTAKSQCAPIRFHTIPKLELQAATMAVRLEQSISAHHSVKIRNRVFWSDSSTVLKWIRSEHRKYKQYVANRVAEILEGSSIEQWKWCPGGINPADDATRAKFPSQYKPNSRWMLGPEFLALEEPLWPKESLRSEIEEPNDEELRKKFVFVASCQVRYEVPSINRFCNFSRYKRATGWMLRYITNLKRRVKKRELVGGPLTADEENEAETYLCRWAQMQVYREDISDLRDKGVISLSSSLRMLNPFIGEDGLIRCNSRLQRAECISPTAKKPIILPSNHPFTRLLIQQYHNKFRHINKETIMCEIRQKFWVPSLRRQVNLAQSNCLLCRIRRAKPIQPQMSELPVDRLQPFVRPFSYTGVDMFGPVAVKIRRVREKRWICLFTCLTVRAIHLEVATDLSSDSFLLCLRNFMNRRGVPKQVRSDNGTNFVGVSAELKGTSNFLDHNSVTEKLAPLGIKWIFNTPANPAQGGIWERLVQSVKKVLYQMLKEEAPRLDTLTSLLIEAECIVNSRPLTHLPVTPDEPEPLTPNHFLLGGTSSTQAPASPEPRFLCLRKQWRVLSNLKNCFWRRWMREYLPEMTRRTKWCLPAKTLCEGSLVLICDAEAPRSKWKRGRIIDLHYGKDGIARSAVVDTTTGVLKRPISKLALLDVSMSPHDKVGVSPSGSTHGVGDVGDTTSYK